MNATPDGNPEKPKRKRKAKAAPEFQCRFCKKVFVSDFNVQKHLCTKKMRWLDKDVAYIRTAFGVYEMFFKFNYGRAVDYQHFMDSKHYSLFVRFGKYIHEVKAVEPMDFAKFVIEKGAGLPITKWPTDTVYEVYLRQKISRENLAAASERSIRTMEKWADEYEETWVDFFRSCPPTLCTFYIQSGRISPLLLYITDSGNGMLTRFSDEQLSLMSEYIDPALWKRRIQMNKSEVKGLQEILREAGL